MKTLVSFIEVAQIVTQGHDATKFDNSYINLKKKCSKTDLSKFGKITN